MANPRFLWILILALLLSHVGLSMQRQPNAAVSGISIHPPPNNPLKQWRPSTSNTIRVSTFNIHRAEGLDGKTDINRIADLLTSDDIVGLQEVLAAPLFGSTDQAEQLARITDSGWLFAPIQKRYYRNYIGNALLSRFKIKNWQRQPLIWSDKLDKNERSRRYRNMITAELELSGTTVKLINTHLDRGDIREAQLARVLAEFDRHEVGILMGDLNTDASSPVLSAWLKENIHADAINLALKSQDKTNRIDWILVRGFRVIDGGMKAEGISDHPYYWTNLALIE